MLRQQQQQQQQQQQPSSTMTKKKSKSIRSIITRVYHLMAVALPRNHTIIIIIVKLKLCTDH